ARDAAIPGSKLQNFFTNALVCPVLTAHPTEVRRKSTIDREMEVAHLLAERDRLRLTPEETAANEEALRRAVLTLWQTSMLRGSRLKVVDEIANGLSYYDYTFLRELPRFYATLEDQLPSTDPAWDGFELPSFLRVGSWIGGDRDGNPFVTAEVLRQALGMQSERAVKFYLDEVHLLGSELSLDGRLVTVAFLADHPKSHDELRRIFTLKLATVREGEEPTRRRALRSEFSDEEWRLVSELADHPNRLLVTATPESGETYAEVAHEAIFRRWHKLRDWIAAEREFLAWRTGLEAARRAWLATPDRTKK